MQRSRSQVLFGILPGMVFQHEDGFIGKVIDVDGRSAESHVNKTVLLERIEQAISHWPEPARLIPLPSKVEASQFQVISPDTVQWEIWPLVFQCTRVTCRRVRRFFTQQEANEHADVNRGLCCENCGGRLAQIRYFTVHNCGTAQPLFTPQCRRCGSRDGVYFEDTGSFSSSVWRCRTCANAYIQGQRFTPCSCDKFGRSGRTPYQRAVSVRDRRSYYAHTLSMINLSTSAYNDLLRNPHRGEIAVASFLGDEKNLFKALRDVNSAAPTNRLSEAEWNKKEAALRAIPLPDEDIAILKAEQGPSTAGIQRTQSDITPDLAGVGENPGVIERAGVWSEIDDLHTIDDAIDGAPSTASTASKQVLEDARASLRRQGFDTVAVTTSFPILLAAFGMTRVSRRPEMSELKPFSRPPGQGGKTPIYVTDAATEALILEVSARAVLGWLVTEDVRTEQVPIDERTARLEILKSFAHADEQSVRIRTLIHSLSHLMVRSLDDGQSGFGESSLAEWYVPEALTFGIYVSSYQTAALGALWTLLHTRLEAWVDRATSSVFSCDNDPLCHLRRPRACERCMYLTFGCPQFNEDLSRIDLMSFVRHMAATSVT